MWSEICDSLVVLLKMFLFLGVIGFIYYIALVIAGLENIISMITGAIGILFAYIIFGGEIDMNNSIWFWNPGCLMMAPIYAVATVILIWQIRD